jgi:hypothetical protein
MAATASSIPWHPAFVQALKLELEPYRDALEFIPISACRGALGNLVFLKKP